MRLGRGKRVQDETSAGVVRLYRAAALSNFVVTIPAFVAYRSLFAEKPNYPFLVHIWSGMAFLRGVMFREI